MLSILEKKKFQCQRCKVYLVYIEFLEHICTAENIDEVKKRYDQKIQELKEEFKKEKEK